MQNLRYFFFLLAEHIGRDDSSEDFKLVILIRFSRKQINYSVISTRLPSGSETTLS
jgi:hypothetical protein